MLSKAAAKYIQSLHHKKFRDEEEVLIAEGSKILNDLIISKQFACNIICATDDWFIDNQALINDLSFTEKIIVNEVELKKISTLHTPNMVLGIFRQPTRAEIILKDEITLMLDDISDPAIWEH